MNSPMHSPIGGLFLGLSAGIDRFNKWQGDWTSLLIYPLLGVVVFEVIMRYGFDAPTIWGFEATTLIYGMHYMFGLAYTDVLDGHVRVDILTMRAPRRIQAAINVLTHLVLFMPVMICLSWACYKFAAVSVLQLEHESSSWAPPLYPFKVIMAVAIFFVLLQGISNLIRELSVLFGKSTSTHEVSEP
jgi:TRAP-type mannitol/chloroaromatic compound transport system permease small subunit